MKSGGVADTFDRLKEQGLIRACGITAAGDTAACLDVINSGRFDTAQIYYNAINPSAAWARVPPGWRGGQDFSGLDGGLHRSGHGHSQYPGVGGRACWPTRYRRNGCS